VYPKHVHINVTFVNELYVYTRVVFPTNEVYIYAVVDMILSVVFACTEFKTQLKYIRHKMLRLCLSHYI
jgi:hypothetical protein